MEVTAKGCRVSFWGNENVLNLIVVMVAQHGEYIESHCTVHFKWVNCMVCELYLEKAVNKTKHYAK